MRYANCYRTTYMWPPVLPARQADVRAPQSLREGLAVETVDADYRHPEHGKSSTCLLLGRFNRQPSPEAPTSHHATAVPSSSTIRTGIASRVTPSIVVVGATPAAPNREASTP